MLCPLTSPAHNRLTPLKRKGSFSSSHILLTSPSTYALRVSGVSGETTSDEWFGTGFLGHGRRAVHQSTTTHQLSAQLSVQLFAHKPQSIQSCVSLTSSFLPSFTFSLTRPLGLSFPHFLKAKTSHAHSLILPHFAPRSCWRTLLPQSVHQIHPLVFSFPHFIAHIALTGPVQVGYTGGSNPKPTYESDSRCRKLQSMLIICEQVSVLGMDIQRPSRLHSTISYLISSPLYNKENRPSVCNSVKLHLCGLF